MVAYRLDHDLMGFAKSQRLRYTRYADDISLSSYAHPAVFFDGEVPSNGRISVDQLSTALKTIIRSNGFDINPDKLWFAGPDSRKEVTGLIVNEFTNVKRTFVRDLRAALYEIEKMGIAEAEKNYQERYNTKTSLEQVLRGRLEWIAQVRGRSFSGYRALARRFNKQFPAAAVPIHPTYADIAERAVWVVDVFIDDKKSAQGTAFFLEGVGLVTANHVLENLKPGEHAILHRPSAPTKEFKVMPSSRRCPHRDLAILDHSVPSVDHLILPVATSPDHTNDDIIALGFPDYGAGDQLSKRPGNILGRATKHGVRMIEVSAVLAGGMSGGPIINDRYQVIGITHRGGYSEHKQLAVDISELLKLAKE